MGPASRRTVGSGVQKTAVSWSTHAMRSRGAPLGPIGMLLFLGGVVWTEVARTRTTSATPVAHDV